MYLFPCINRQLTHLPGPPPPPIFFTLPWCHSGIPPPSPILFCWLHYKITQTNLQNSDFSYLGRNRHYMTNTAQIGRLSLPPKLWTLPRLDPEKSTFLDRQRLK